MADKQNSSDSEGLEKYYIENGDLHNVFWELVQAETLPKRILVIHGFLGGVGKSSMLRMFNLQCKRAGVPAAISFGDVDKSVLDIINTWVSHLKSDGIKFPLVDKTINKYRRAQIKLSKSL